jgi:hypothetical protein
MSPSTHPDLGTCAVLIADGASEADISRCLEHLRGAVDEVLVARGRLGEALAAVSPTVRDVVLVDVATVAAQGVGPVTALLAERGAAAATVVPVVAVTDALKHVVDGRVVATVDRSELFAPQLPQVFARADLARLLPAEVGDPLPALLARGADVLLLERGR